jgi:thioredoxin 1
MRHPDILHTTDAACGQDVLNSDEPVLVDFWADWRGPGRTVGSLVDQIASECRNSLRVVKINADDAPGTARNFGGRVAG